MHPEFDWPLSKRSEDYQPPLGNKLLAIDEGNIVGCVAYRTPAQNVVEMQRLFVEDHVRGKGVGGQLSLAVLERAREGGCCSVRLEAAHLLSEAQRLYRSIGFVEREPFYGCHPDLRTFIVFMERSLQPGER